MSSQILPFEELRHVPLEELIHQVLAQQKTLTILVSDDQEVTIQLRPREASNNQETAATHGAGLKPLPVLEGYVPEGWKDAIYG